MERSLLCLFYCFFWLCPATGTTAAAAFPAESTSIPVVESRPDPRGPAFKTKSAAKAYRRRHGLRGKIRQQADGTYAIETATGSIQRDPRTAELVYPDRNHDGIVFAALVTAPPLETNSALRTGPDKIPPLDFWQRLNGGQVDGARYSPRGYYIGPAPLAGEPPGPGRYFKATRILKGLRIGSSISKAKAIERLRKGQDVYVASRAEAKKLMKKAGGMRTFRESAHGKGFFDHFHDGYRKLKGHPFFGKPKTP